MSVSGAEGVAAAECEKWCQASFSVPGAADMIAVDAVAILDSASGITTMSVGIANKLQMAYPDVQVVGGHRTRGKVADGRVLVVEKKTCPVRIALHTSSGLVTLDTFSFTVIQGDDGVFIHGNLTLKVLDIDVDDSLGARARERAAEVGVDTAPYRQCRRVNVSVDALQQQTSLKPEESDEAVERLLARGPDIDMARRRTYGPGLRHWRVPFGYWRLLGCEICTWSVFEKSLVGAGMLFGVGYYEVVICPRVWSPCASP